MGAAQNVRVYNSAGPRGDQRPPPARWTCTTQLGGVGGTFCFSWTEEAERWRREREREGGEREREGGGVYLTQRED